MNPPVPKNRDPEIVIDRAKDKQRQQDESFRKFSKEIDELMSKCRLTASNTVLVGHERQERRSHRPEERQEADADSQAQTNSLYKLSFGGGLARQEARGPTGTGTTAGRCQGDRRKPPKADAQDMSPGADARPRNRSPRPDLDGDHQFVFKHTGKQHATAESDLKFLFKSSPPDSSLEKHEQETDTTKSYKNL